MFLKTASNIPLDKALVRADDGLEEVKEGCLVKYGMTRNIGVCASYDYPSTGISKKVARFTATFSFMNFFPCVISGSGDTQTFRDKTRKRFRGLDAGIYVTPLKNSQHLAVIRFPMKPVKDGFYHKAVKCIYDAFIDAFEKSPSVSGTIGIEYIDDETKFPKYMARIGCMPVIEVAVGETLLNSYGWLDLNAALLNGLRGISELCRDDEDEDEEE